jgi:hypothetical protein
LGEDSDGTDPSTCQLLSLRKLFLLVDRAQEIRLRSPKHSAVFLDGIKDFLYDAKFHVLPVVKLMNLEQFLGLSRWEGHTGFEHIV